MTKDKWGSEWPVKLGNESYWEDVKANPEDYGLDKGDWLTHTSDVAHSPQSGVNWPKPVALGFNDTAVSKAITKLVEGNYDTSKLKSQGSNLVDDQAYLYFQCESCNDILDPHTKSFAKLQEHRVNAGWKCVWNFDGMGYKVYCAKCGEKV